MELKIEKGTFADFENNKNKYDFFGVYIIKDKNNEIVYVGSAYGQTITERLQQYIDPSDSGNTLGKNVAKELFKDYTPSYEEVQAKIEKFKNNAKNKDKSDDELKKKAVERCKMEKAVEEIYNFKIVAIEHHDLEYLLIKSFDPKYNKNGK